MQLDVHGKRVNDPTPDEIKRGLQSLDEVDDGYIILSRDELTYVQAAGIPSQGFQLEYQDGSTEDHCRATPDSVPSDVVESVLLKYLDEDDSWKTVVTWEKMDPSKTGCLSSSAVVFLALTALWAMML